MLTFTFLLEGIPALVAAINRMWEGVSTTCDVAALDRVAGLLRILGGRIDAMEFFLRSAPPFRICSSPAPSPGVALSKRLPLTEALELTRLAPSKE